MPVVIVVHNSYYNMSMYKCNDMAIDRTFESPGQIIIESLYLISSSVTVSITQNFYLRNYTHWVSSPFFHSKLLINIGIKNIQFLPTIIVVLKMLVIDLTHYLPYYT